MVEWLRLIKQQQDFCAPCDRLGVLILRDIRCEEEMDVRELGLISAARSAAAYETDKDGTRDDRI